MKQLMMKDYMIQKTQVFLTTLLLIGLIIIWYSTGTQIELIYLFGGLVISLSLISGGLSYDDNNDATMFLLTLPVKRKSIVISKYITGFLTVLMGALITFVLVEVLNIIVGSSTVPPWEIIFGSFVGNLIAVAIIFAVYYAFGYQNIKYITIGFIILSVMGSVLYTQTDFLKNFMEIVPNFSAAIIVLISLFVAFLMYGSSLIWSIRAMEQKGK